MVCICIGFYSQFAYAFSDDATVLIFSSLWYRI